VLLISLTFMPFYYIEHDTVHQLSKKGERYESRCFARCFPLHYSTCPVVPQYCLPIASHFCGPCHSQCRCRVSQRSAARLWTRKAWGKTCMQMKQGLHPAADIGGGRGCASQCGMVLLLHLLLLSASALWFALLPL